MWGGLRRYPPSRGPPQPFMTRIERADSHLRPDLPNALQSLAADSWRGKSRHRHLSQMSQRPDLPCVVLLRAKKGNSPGGSRCCQHRHEQTRWRSTWRWVFQAVIVSCGRRRAAGFGQCSGVRPHWPEPLWASAVGVRLAASDWVCRQAGLMSVSPCAVSVEMGWGDGHHRPAPALTVERELRVLTRGKHVCEPPNLPIYVALHADAPWFGRSSRSTPRRSRCRCP
jgi:hypothetical protein